MVKVPFKTYRESGLTVIPVDETRCNYSWNTFKQVAGNGLTCVSLYRHGSCCWPRNHSLQPTFSVYYLLKFCASVQVYER